LDEVIKMVVTEINNTLTAPSPSSQKKARPTMLNELINRYASDNEAEGKSPRTIIYYSDPQSK